MQGKVIKALVGLAVGWFVSQVATDLLEDVGVPKHTATVAGGLIGWLA